MEKLLILSLRTLVDAEADAKAIGELVDHGFCLVYLADRPGDTKETATAWLSQHDLAPSGFGHEGSTWVVQQQPSLATMPLDQWQVGMVEHISLTYEPKVLLVVSVPETHEALRKAILYPCFSLLISDLQQAVDYARAEHSHLPCEGQ